MIAFSKDFRRSRTWLQSKLWYDRSSDRGAASLRQCLLEIRQAFGVHAGVLISTRSTVELDSNAVQVVQETTDPEGVVLEGIDIRGATFNDWLKTVRAQVKPSTDFIKTAGSSAGLPRPSPPSVLIELSADGSQLHGALSVRIEDIVMRSLTEAMDVHVMRASSSVASQKDHSAAILVQLQVFDIGTSTGFRATVEESTTLRCHWSDYVNLAGGWNLEGGEFLGLVHRLVEAVGSVVASSRFEHAASEQLQASALAVMAVRKMFSMQHAEIAHAGKLLDQAIAIAPRGLYHAWRTQLAAIRLVERQTGDFKTLHEACSADIALALETEPMNSNVLACVSNARLIFDEDHESSLILSRQSTLANPSNPLGWWARANATLYAGDKAAAYQAALMAQQLSERSSFKAWSDFQRALTAAVNQRFDEALAYGASSHALAPHFRPPLRYLIALSARAGRMESSAKAAAKLRKLEPDFSVERLWSDPDYPVSIMRKSGLAHQASLERIEEG